MIPLTSASLARRALTPRQGVVHASSLTAIYCARFAHATSTFTLTAYPVLSLGRTLSFEQFCMSACARYEALSWQLRKARWQLAGTGKDVRHA